MSLVAFSNADQNFDLGFSLFKIEYQCFIDNFDSFIDYFNIKQFHSNINFDNYSYLRNLILVHFSKSDFQFILNFYFHNY